MERKPRRHSIRLRNYDYASSGYYFVTICTHERWCLLGNVSEGKMHLNDLGEIVRECWMEIPSHFASAVLDVFVVMPNHVHGIVVLNPGAINHAPTKSHRPFIGAQFIAPGTPYISTSLGSIVRSFKSRSTISTHRAGQLESALRWQRNYYEHVIRSEASLRAIREYIVNNPRQWDLDTDNPRHR